MIVKDGKRVKCISFEQYGTEGKASSELIVYKALANLSWI